MELGSTKKQNVFPYEMICQKSELDSLQECVQNAMMVHSKHKTYHAFFCFVFSHPDGQPTDTLKW